MRFFFLLLLLPSFLTAEIEEPDLEGVDQLLVLSNRYVIVALSNMDEVLDQINRLSDGKFDVEVQKWVKNKNDWTAWHAYRNLYKQHIVKARELAGERELDSPGSYTITSSRDSNYQTSKSPSRVTRTIVSLDKAIIPGEYEVHWAQYCYLEFPEPMRTGNTYTIEVQGKKVTFLFDELKTVSRAIKVNQAGYLPDAAQKFAYVGCYLQELGPMDCSHAKTFQVIDASSGQVVHEGELFLRSKNPKIKPAESDSPLITGEDTYEIDLTGLKKQGDFYLSIPGIGRSWTFRHADDAYGDVFYIATRGLYHQRCGIAIGQPYTAWPRIKCHTDPVFENQMIELLPPMPRPQRFERFDIIGGTFDKSISTPGPTWGWHDASDWDRNITHYMCLFDLLYAYEIAKDRFLDGQLNIPESGNGIPDILSEAEYGLRVWKKSLDENFGASGSVETWTHPTIDDPRYPYSYSRRTRWASLEFAAAAAQFSELVAPFNDHFSQLYKDLALKAYEFGIDPKNSLGKVEIEAKEGRGSGKPYYVYWEEKDAYSTPYRIHAALRLYSLTEEPSFLDGVADLLESAPKPFVWPFSPKDVSGWIYFSLFSDKIKDQFPKPLLAKWEGNYLSLANDYIKFSPTQAYRQSWPSHQDYWMSWGATCMTNQARVLLMAYHLTKDKKYRDAALINFDFMLGANPMGMSWTTGIGKVYPINIQHAVSEDDGIPDPVPGITLYGITEGIFYDLKTEVWENKQPDGKVVSFIPEANKSIPVFRHWSCHPHRNTPQCEFTIHKTMSSTLFCAAMLIPDNWMPSEELKKRKPTPKNQLHGLYYLP